MARVIPSGTTDYTTQIAMREAAANDALHRLYITLAKKREERLQQQEFMREMLGLKDQYTRGIYNDFGPPGSRGGNPNFSQWSPPVDTGSDDNPLADKGGVATDAATPPAQPQQRPYVGPNPDAFTKPPGQQSQAPIDQIGEAAKAMAQAPAKGETTTLSAQTMFGKPPASMKTTGSKSAAAKKEDYRYIGPNTMASWSEAEKRNGLPQGTLLMVLGLENNGGYSLGANRRSQGGASGLFQSTPEWRRDYKVPESAQNDAVTMGDAVAAGIARSKANIEQRIGRKLTDSPKDMAFIYAGWMWGVGNGPRIAEAYHKSPDTPMRNVLLPSRAKDGSVVSPMQTMANNGIPTDATVKQYVEQGNTGLFPRVQQWHNKAMVRLQNQPVAPTDIPRNTTGIAVGTPTPSSVPQGANFAGRGEGGQYKFADTANMVAVPTPDGSGRTVVVHRDAAPIVHGLLKDLHDAGAPMESIGGFVPKNIKGSRTPSQHGFGFAIDFSQRGRNAVSPAFRNWAVANKDTLGRILAKHQVRSGGDWRNPDFGHFEIGPEALAAYKNRQAQPKAVAAAAPPIPPTKPMDYDKTGVSPFAGVVAGEKAPQAASLVSPNTVFDPSMRRPQAAAIAGTTSAPSSAPQPAIKNVPPESSAAANVPSPQTDQPIEQKTQAIPAPTAQQVAQDSGYTADDMDEKAATRLSAGEQVPIPRERGSYTEPDTSALETGLLKAGDAIGNVGGDILWAAGDIGKKVGGAVAGAVTPEARYTDPAYVESQQGFDEAGMEGIQNYVTPEAVPGEGTAALKAGANNIIQSIQNKAKEYSALQAGRNESKQLEQMYNYPQAQAPVQSEPPPDPNDFRDPRNLQKAQEILMRGRQLDEIRRNMVPDYQEPPSRRAPDRDALRAAVRAQQQNPTQPPVAAPTTPPAQAPLPVPASDVADAMYNTGESVPSYGQIPSASGSGGMSWISKLFENKPDTSPVKAKPVKPQNIKLTPGGAPFIQPQPPMQLGGQGTPMQVPQQSSGQTITTPQGQLEMQYDENGMPVFRPMVQ